VYVLPKRANDLKPNKIMWVVQTSAAVPRAVQPGFSYQYDNDRARGNPLLDRVHKVLACPNGVDIDKDEVSSQVRSQGVVKPAGIAGRIISPVANENATHEWEPVYSANWSISGCSQNGIESRSRLRASDHRSSGSALSVGVPVASLSTNVAS
jgi:hypothetical protein